ncbi:OprD family porin [uncultured Pseudomonas sp.]|uniref:OprD family porin n=1 Tax=uncultured Pseudomonas sp. TaxID=114707 RepID=UPI0025EA856E|nr:OprD family porin [uncultured Pseudomonas sp.]
MTPRHWSAVALAVSASLNQLAMAETIESQDDAKGFAAGSSMSILARNQYFNRDRQDGDRDNRDWAQGFIGNYSSGFTQGTVGVGIDAFGHFAVKLDAQEGDSGTGNLPLKRDGKAADSFGSAGAALKLRVSKTQLRYGNLQPTAPVFAVGGTRLLPQSATGLELKSSEIDGLDLEAGRYTSTNSNVTTNQDHDIYALYANVTARKATYAGGVYQITPNWTASLYAAQFEDVWNQYYANTNYVLALGGDQSLTFDANLYRTLDQGQAKAGAIDNTTASLAATYAFLGAHSITLSAQKVHGDTPFDYLAVGNNGNGEGGDSVLLAHSVQWSDFNGPNERSFGITYNLDMTPYGVPGLSFMARHMRGYDVDGTRVSADSAYAGLYGADGKHNETDLEAKYVVQSGAAKDLSLRVRQAFHRANADQGEGDVSELRLIVDYPITLL